MKQLSGDKPGTFGVAWVGDLHLQEASSQVFINSYKKLNLRRSQLRQTLCGRRLESAGKIWLTSESNNVVSGQHVCPHGQKRQPYLGRRVMWPTGSEIVVTGRDPKEPPEHLNLFWSVHDNRTLRIHVVSWYFLPIKQMCKMLKRSWI